MIDPAEETHSPRGGRIATRLPTPLHATPLGQRAFVWRPSGNLLVGGRRCTSREAGQDAAEDQRKANSQRQTGAIAAQKSIA